MMQTVVLIAIVASILQAAPGPVEELGPPHEELLRSYEMLGSVLCGAQDRHEQMRQIARRYHRRMKAVTAKVADKFGAEAAARGYITVGPCLVFKEEYVLARRLRAAMKEFENELVVWEVRYGLRED